MKAACLFGQSKKNNNEERAGLSPALLFVITILVLVFIFLLLPFNKMIVVSNEKTKKILFTLPIKSGEIVDLKFTHSVNLSPVVDRFQFDGRILVLQSTIFQTYGAGIPILEDGLGQSFEHTENGFEINGIDVPQEKIPIMLQAVPDHRILYRGKEIHLLDFASSGTIISITVDRVSFIKRFSTTLKTP